MLAVLDKLEVWIDETPPIEQPMRFGNKAFRQWFEALETVSKRSEGLLPIPDNRINSY